MLIDSTEAGLLHEILEAHLTQLRVEMGRADTNDFKARLLARYERVEALMRRVDATSLAASPIL